MKINFKKNYKFAVKSALYVSLFAAGFVMLLFKFMAKYESQNILFLGSVFFLIFFYFLFPCSAISSGTIYLQTGKKNL